MNKSVKKEEVRNCSNCSAVILPDDEKTPEGKFCPHCGFPLRESLNDLEVFRRAVLFCDNQTYVRLFKYEKNYPAMKPKHTPIKDRHREVIYQVKALEIKGDQKSEYRKGGIEEAKLFLPTVVLYIRAFVLNKGVLSPSISPKAIDPKELNLEKYMLHDVSYISPVTIISRIVATEEVSNEE